MALPEKICILPWISIETSPIGTARPCCLAEEEITKPDGTKYSLTEHTIDEIYHSEYMQKLRQQFLNGEKPGTCRRCWDEESNGRTSKRMNSRVRLKDYYDQVRWDDTNPDQLWFLDLKLGNICNLKCRICGSWSSSKWAREELDYIPKEYRKDHIATTWMKQGTWPRDNTEFWLNMNTLLPNIKYLEFTGGEPFLIQQHFDFLKTAVRTGHAEHIEIHYNTNGTQYPEEAIELWSNFKHVEIAFSIDNTGKRFEYERYGAIWEEAQENIKKFNNLKTQKLSTQLCWTANIQNVYYLPEISEWIQTQEFDYIHFNMLHDPWHMSISRMTPEAQKLVIDRLTSYEFIPKHKIEVMRILKVIENGEGSDGNEFRTRMKIMDEYRKESFLTTHEAIARAMGYEA